MYILGLNAYHGDSSACIIKDGIIIAATEEERFNRIKHWAGFPAEAIKFCLNEAKITCKQVDYITISKDPKANLSEKIFYSIKTPGNYRFYLSRLLHLKKVIGLQSEFKRYFTNENITNKIVHVEHHLSHLASAFFASPFDNSALLSIDGFGDYTSTMTGIGKGNQIKVLNKVIYPHSCGIFYTAFTQFLGFPNYGDEYKVMGLSPYGKPIYLDKLRDTILLTKNGMFELNTSYFNHITKGISMTWDNGAPSINNLFSNKFIKKFGLPRGASEEITQFHKDLAS